MDVNKTVAIVTGGIRGIGFVTIQNLLRHGAEYVAIFDLHKLDSDVVIDALKKLEQEFDKQRFGYYRCDVTKLDEFIACFDDVTNLKKNVDILINNAGVIEKKNIDLTIDVNLTAVVHCTMHAISRMGTHRLGKGGVIVNIASIFGLINTKLLPLYCATKHGVVSFVRSMKEHNKKLGVRIVCICPGMTRTAMTTTYDPEDRAFDFITPEEMKVLLEMPLQDPNNVASGIVEIVKRGKGGDVWVVQNDEPPFNTGDINNVEDLKIAF